MNKILIIFIALFFISSCKNETKGKVIAKVYENELHTSDITFLFEGKNLSISDSAKISKNYIDRWVDEQILLHQSNGIDLDMSLINDKTNHYKNILIINQLENNYINTHLDTMVSQNEYITYYKDHKDDFQLNDYLVKILYVKVPVDAPEINKLEKWYKLNQSSDIKEIENYAKLYASNFYYDTLNWIYFDDLTKEIPLIDFNKDRFITRKSKIIIDENDYFYFLNVIDYKLKNTTSPLEFEKHNIKQRILNTRVKALKEEFKKQNIEKAYNEKAVKIY
jgi:hypothetical protein